MAGTGRTSEAQEPESKRTKAEPEPTGASTGTGTSTGTGITTATATAADSESEFEYGEDDEDPSVDEETWLSTFSEARESQPAAEATLDVSPGARRIDGSATLYLCKAQQLAAQSASASVFRCEFVDDNVFHWSIHLLPTGFAEDLAIRRELLQLEKKYIELDVTFPKDFPYNPPLVRIVRPRVTADHVYDGAFCLELLLSGWQSSYTIEAICLQLFAMLSEGHVEQEGSYSMSAFKRSQRMLESHHKTAASFSSDRPTS